ncbi:ArsC family reductase [Curvivirga aplysinae]|uniref:ArsC family reductase n=1 Tax=Curvivirga aplysinae TaxID=2529852 RepID=UPI001C3FDC3D|nr:ArsC family reductase [Curvivirga aplysinae]
MSLIVYGLKNCDTCKKAKKWLDEQDKSYEFKDLRADGFSEDNLSRWLEMAGWEILLNKRGTTWRALSDEVKNSTDASNVKALMLESPALMKRPIFDFGDRVVVGFTAKQQVEL